MRTPVGEQPNPGELIKPPLHLGDPSPRMVHLCVDMQRMFFPGSLWGSSWTERILPTVARIASHSAERTVFTRFIPPVFPSDLPGMWQRYYQRWEPMTRQHLDPAQLDLLPPLAALVPPAVVVDKTTYSAFMQPELHNWLRSVNADSVAITGAETDVCILATVLGAVDYGYRVTIVTDGICSSSDPGHEALLDLYAKRFSEQIDTVESDELLDRWRPSH